MNEQTVEERAKAMGWVPKEEFRGDPEKWRDAAEYVERGETLLPIVQASNRELREQLRTTEGRITELTTQLSEAREAIDTLVKHNSEENRKKMRDSLAATKDQIVEAREQGNHAEAVRLEEVLDDQKVALRDAEAAAPKETKKADKQSDDSDFTKSPEWTDWVKDNDWFGVDKRKSSLALGIADEIRSNPETKNLRGRAFLDKVSEEVGKVFGTPKQRESKVESGARSGDGGGDSNGKGKSYSDLPPDAKAACDNDARKLVGPNRAFKTLAEWRQNYTNDYFSQE